MVSGVDLTWYNNLAMVEQHMARDLKSTTILERRRIAASTIVDNPHIGAIDGTILRRASGILLRSPTQDDAIDRWRSIPIYFGSEDLMTQWQVDMVNLPEEEIASMYHRVQNIPLSHQLNEIVLERVMSGHGHVISDQDQRHRVKERRNKLQQIHAKLSPDKTQLLKSLLQQYPEVPLLETAKNARIVDLQRYRLSKVSLLVHDLFDHIWLHDFIEQKGMITEYKSLFERVGNMNMVDSFNREGELIASIGYEWRASFSPDRDFTQTFSLGRIKKLLQKAPTPISSNISNALDLLVGLDPASQESRRLESMISGMMIEALESQRKFGYIKDLSSTDPFKRFSLLTPEYLAFIIDTNHLLENHHDALSHALLSVEGMCEEYLESAVKETVPRPFVFKLNDINDYNFLESPIDEQRKTWIQNNFYHLAVKRSLLQ